MRAPIFLTLCIIFGWALTPSIASAQSPVVKKGVTEVLEILTRSGGKNATEELAEYGGERAIRELVEKVAMEGGEQLVGEVVALAKSQGPRVIKAIEADPVVMTRALRSIPEDKIAGSLAESMRNPGLIAKLTRRHGAEALELSASHPGVGAKVIDEFGESGLKAARALETEDMITLAKVKGLNDLPSTSRRDFLETLGRNPKGVNQAIKVAAAGTALVLTADFVTRLKEETLGETGRFNRQSNTLLWSVVALIVAVFGGYAGIKLWGVWKNQQAKLQ